ncbi:ribonuclease H-like domain-containing protein [Candidatus Aerophobetes bacterium]|nr:ribonuclease H-like domain-containing protein [Candidatus Aerophobetes bacterium]
MNKVVLDVETQRSFDEVGGRHMHLLGVSVVGIYQYPTEKYLTFEEKDIPNLDKMLQHVDLAIGFNLIGFDFPVLEPYLSFPLSKLHTLDIMQEIVKAAGHRVSLNSVAQATLGELKTGTGLEAIKLFRKEKMKELKKYCLDDVCLTKELYEYGLNHGEILFSSKAEQKENWNILHENRIIYWKWVQILTFMFFLICRV